MAVQFPQAAASAGVSRAIFDPKTKVSNYTKEQVGRMDKSLVRFLSDKQLKYITVRQVSGLTDRQIQILPPSRVRLLFDAKQLNLLAPGQLDHLTNQQLDRITNPALLPRIQEIRQQKKHLAEFEGDEKEAPPLCAAAQASDGSNPASQVKFRAGETAEVLRASGVWTKVVITKIEGAFISYTIPSDKGIILSVRHRKHFRKLPPLAAQPHTPSIGTVMTDGDAQSLLTQLFPSRVQDVMLSYLPPEQLLKYVEDGALEPGKALEIVKKQLADIDSLDVPLMKSYIDVMTKLTGNEDFVAVHLLQLTKKLTHLDLSCLDVDDNFLTSIARFVPNLTQLDVSGSWNLTDAGITAVAASCPKLAFLNAYGCMKLTDAGIKSLAAGCSKLTHLVLSFCENLTGDGIAAVAAGCPNLTHVDARACEELTYMEVASLNERFPNLEIRRA